MAGEGEVVGYMSPENMQMVLDTIRQIRESGILNTLPGDKFKPWTPTPLYFTNVSGEEIPAWACMQVTGTAEIGGQNYLEADQPADSTGEAGWFIFNGPSAVAEDQEGVAQWGPAYRAFKDSGTITGGDRWQPVASEWYLEQSDGGIFICAGEDDIDTDVLRVFLPGGGGGGSKLVQTPGGGIAARSGTTVSSGSCTEFKIVTTTLTTNTNTLTVFNPWPFAIPASLYIVAVQEHISGKWIALHPGVMNVRWDDPDLEQTLDLSTYSNIDTAEDCS